MIPVGHFRGGFRVQYAMPTLGRQHTRHQHPPPPHPRMHLSYPIGADGRRHESKAVAGCGMASVEVDFVVTSLGETIGIIEQKNDLVTEAVAHQALGKSKQLR